MNRRPGCAGRALAIAGALAGCGTTPVDPSVGDQPSDFERTIASELSFRLGVAVTARCAAFPVMCHVVLPDRRTLPVDLHAAGSSIEWQISGLILTTDAIERYLRGELADLGASQEVRCAPRIQRLAAGERILCGLANGGIAFVTVHLDGSFGLELELSAGAARARSEPEATAELVKRSHAVDDPGDDKE